MKRTLVEEGECLLELRDLLLGKFLSHFEVEKEWKEMVRGEERGKRDEQSKRAATGLVTSRDEAAIFLSFFIMQKIEIMDGFDYRRLPKAELHAHLHGSIRDATLLELLDAAAASSAPLAAMRVLRETERQRSLSDCFALFDSIHQVVDTPAAVERIAAEVVEDFAADGVRYLELRTTPRFDKMTPYEYIDAIEHGVQRASAASSCVVRLLLSINRGQSVARADATVDLAISLCRSGYGRVVGVDLSGNPTVGDFASFIPCLQRARQNGLRVTVHCAEVVKPAEVRAIAAFAPDRLGHALHLPRDVLQKLLARVPRIPIEICPSSNSHTLQMRTLTDHPTLGTWLEEAYPISICTDDAGVFATSASEELRRVAAAFGLSPPQLARLAAAPFAHAFADGGKDTVFAAMLTDVAAEYVALGFAACGAGVAALSAQWRSAL